MDPGTYRGAWPADRYRIDLSVKHGAEELATMDLTVSANNISGIWLEPGPFQGRQASC